MSSKDAFLKTKTNSHCVVLLLTNVEPSDYCILVGTVVHFPVDKVDLFEQLLFMKFEFTDHFREFVRKIKQNVSLGCFVVCVTRVSE